LNHVIPAKAGIYINNYLYGFCVKHGLTEVRNSYVIRIKSKKVFSFSLSFFLFNHVVREQHDEF